MDPGYDTPEILNAYAEKRHADGARWIFLTGDKKQIYSLARNSYLVDAAVNTAEKNDFIHSQMLVLVDGSRHIRGYYDGTSREEWKRLIDEVIVLRLEQDRIKLNKQD